jgi:hypothetical protein
VARSIFPSTFQSLVPDVSGIAYTVPTPLELESDVNGSHLSTGELETPEDLFMAAREQQTPPEASLDEESSEDADTDSTSSSGMLIVINPLIT